MDFVRKHIESLPAVESHYCRKESTGLYLEEKLKNIANIYRLYKEKLNECYPGEQFHYLYTNDVSSLTTCHSTTPRRTSVWRVRRSKTHQNR